MKKDNGLTIYQKSVKKWGWLFLGPVMLAFAVGFLWPFLKGLYLSFCDFRLISEAKLSGFDNYVKAFSDESFMHSFLFTALFTVVSMTVINLLAFTVAYFLAKEIRGMKIFRTVFFMPNLIGGIVLGYIWSTIFDGFLSMYETSVLMESKYGFWGLIIMLCWQQVGYMMIIYIAGFKNIDPAVLEAAQIDGANGRQTLLKIMIPNMITTISICLFLALTNGFKLFDQNLALTAGLPISMNADGTSIKTTEMMALNIFNTFYGQSSFGHGVAQAKAVIFFVLVSAIGIIQLKFTDRKKG
ncbi:MAG: sugar ABC transporter permease [Lachnospiraceae bacterium]|jgi:raffinose/stachyose/melibiose transport system permease protein|nr:sugar ABC transporter permease [Lachnospiraceae bacterium]